MADIKYQLRKSGFPQCAAESLNIIETLIVAHNTGRTIISNTMELVNEIISEFIFGKRNTENKFKQKQGRGLNNIQELQLMEVFCAHFLRINTGISIVDNLALHNTVFMCLFSEVSRDQLLVKLVSMSVATKSRVVLVSAGLWLQQVGPTTPRGLSLAKGVVNDYLNLVPGAVEQLHDLPALAPEFSTAFLASVAQLYCATDDSTTLPPESLLKVVTLWINKSPTLCNAPTPVSPMFGLLRWGVLAPLHSTEDSPLYSQLHLALLESILICGQHATVPAHQLALLVNTILNRHRQQDSSKLKQALDRLTQAVIVLLRAGSVSGNVTDLFQQMDLLPKNEFMEGFAMCRNYVKAPPYYKPQRTKTV